MTAQLVLGPDTDNYDREVSVARYRHLKDAYGAAFAIVSCEGSGENPNVTELQIRNAEEAELLVPFSYRFLYWDTRDLDRMKEAVQFGKPVGIDLEYGSGMAGGPPATLQRILEARDYLQSQGMYWGLYSGEWWLPEHVGMLGQPLAGDRYWHAAYPFGVGKLPPIGWLPDFKTFEPYSGIVRPTAWQYADTCYDEPSFDLNAMYLDLSPAGPVFDPRDIQLSIDAARFDSIKALADGRWIARHSDDKSAVEIQDQSGHPLTGWMRLYP